MCRGKGNNVQLCNVMQCSWIPWLFCGKEGHSLTVEEYTDRQQKWKINFSRMSWQKVTEEGGFEVCARKIFCLRPSLHNRCTVFCAYTVAIFWRRCVAPSCTSLVWYSSLRHIGHDLRPVNRSNDCRQACHTTNERHLSSRHDYSFINLNQMYAYTNSHKNILHNIIHFFQRKPTPASDHAHFISVQLYSMIHLHFTVIKQKTLYITCIFFTFSTLMRIPSQLNFLLETIV